MATGIFWDESLPQQPLVDGYDRTPVKTIIRTPMDAAVAKQRARFSTAAKNESFFMIFSLAQFIFLETDFFEQTLKNGSLEFNMPKAGFPSEYEVKRFTEEAYNPTFLGTCWRVKLNLEILP